MDDIILRVKDICKYYPGVKALDGVNFEVKRGEVHAICGENGAGKSTFIKILTGANEPTSGTIEFNGKEYAKLTPKQSMELGISVIYQEFSLIPYLSVAENIFYGREIKKGIIRDIAAMEKQAKELCKEMGVDIDVHKRVCDLGIAYQQIVEILKAVSKKSEFIIMDEPTAPLTVKETAVFFKIIQKLKQDHVTIIFISHRLEEVFEICDRVSVFCDGKYIVSKDVQDITKKQLITYMVGRELSDDYPEPKRKIGETLLKVEHLKNKRVHDVSFELKKGEILGLKFQDFDFEKQTVRISRQLVGNLKLKEKEFTVTEYAVIERNPKTENSYRILRVPKVVMQEVKRRQQLIELRKTDSGIEYKNFDYVCCQENGEPRSLTAMNQALTKICNRNGLPNITVHGLRHMFATILIELGVPLFKISGLLGHSSVHTTYEYYCEIMDEQDKIIAFVNNTFVPQRTGTEG